jgi:hypothetical protein
MKKLNLIGSGAVLLLCLVAGSNSPVWSAIIPVGPVDWTGSRTTPNASGVVANEVVEDDWTNDEDGFQISWTITEDTVYHYTYQLKNKNGC